MCGHDGKVDRGILCCVELVSMWIRIVACFFMICALLATPAVAANKLKCTSIKVVVPYAVGSATDLILRAYTETINRHSTGPLLKVVNVTKKTVVADAIKTPADGCKLLAASLSLVAEQLAGEAKAKWSDLAPVAMLTRSPLVVVARGDMKDATLPNIIEIALEDSGAIGIGEARSALGRMMLMCLEDASGARFQIMTYDTGRQSLMALLAGKLDIGLVSPSAAKRRVDQKELQALAVTTEVRSTLLPSVPTLREEGIGAAFGIDRGLFAPKATTPELLAEISGWFKKAADDPALAERIGEVGTELRYLGPEDYARYLQNLTADWIEMIGRAVGKQNRRRPS